MGHGPADHIEHAEHASHAAHDDYDKLVTISIAVIAAVLAGVSILGHKTHNLMLSRQLMAGISKNEESDKWTEYQAYNIRSHMYRTQIEVAESTPAQPGTESARAKAIERWKTQVDKYENVSMPAARKAVEKHEADRKRYLDEGVRLHHRAERLDLGDLGLQLGVVFASLAILTKRRTFWYLGLGCAVAGFLWAMTGQFDLFMGHHDELHGSHDPVAVKGH